MMCTIQQCNKVRTSKNTQARYRGANILRNIGIDIPIKNIDKTAENLAEAINQHTYLKERILMGSDWYMTEMAVYSMGSYYNSMFELLKKITNKQWKEEDGKTRLTLRKIVQQLLLIIQHFWGKNRLINIYDRQFSPSWIFLL